MPPPLAANCLPEPEATRDLRCELKRLRSPLNFQLAPLLDAFERYLTASSRREEQLETRIQALERQAIDQADKLAFQEQRISGLMPPGEFVTDEQFALMQGDADLLTRGLAGGSEPTP